MSGVPDYALETTLDFKFSTRQFTTGAPFAFASGAIEIYEDNSITQITGAETLTLEFDGKTGLHNLRVVATAANGFESGKSYQCVVSAGTVDSVSVVGEVVQQFSLGRAADAIWAKTMTELGAVPGVTGTVLAALEWLFQLARNKGTQTSTTKTLRNDADDGDIATSAISDDGTTFVRSKWT